MDILKDVNAIFVDVLENDDLVINRETSSADVEEWDSLNHIQLIVSIEKHFNMKFSSQEIRHWKNVGEMCDAIAEKMAVA
jgi:acyl carrier protein